MTLKTKTKKATTASKFQDYFQIIWPQCIVIEVNGFPRVLEKGGLASLEAFLSHSIHSTYVFVVLRGQRIKLIHVVSTFMNIDGTTYLFSKLFQRFSAGPQKHIPYRHYWFTLETVKDLFSQSVITVLNTILKIEIFLGCEVLKWTGASQHQFFNEEFIFLV